jgi:hypothetical protein
MINKEKLLSLGKNRATKNPKKYLPKWEAKYLF